MSHRYRQHRYVAAVFFAGLLLIGGGYALLQSAWIPENAFRWTCAAVMALPVLIWRILIAFPKEPGKLPDAYFPGLANQLTIFRGLLICLLTGFLSLNPPEGFLAWIPDFLYSTALIMDGFDGYLARLRKETSAFGTFLDRDLDCLGNADRHPAGRPLCPAAGLVHPFRDGLLSLCLRGMVERKTRAAPPPAAGEQVSTTCRGRSVGFHRPCPSARDGPP